MSSTPPEEPGTGPEEDAPTTAEGPDEGTEPTAEIPGDGTEPTAEIPTEPEADAASDTGSEAASDTEPASETQQLRDEVARLEARLEESAAAPPPDRPGRTSGVLRGIAVVLCAVLVAMLAPLAVVASWAEDQMSDTDRYVQTVAPLASDPAVQNAVIDRITTAITDRLDVRAVTQEAVDALSSQGLPPRAATSLSALITPLTNGVTNFIHDQVARLVRSDAFAQAWEEANRQAHAQMVALLTGNTGDGAVQVEGHAVKLNLAVLIDTVQKQLVDAGFTLAGNIPTPSAEFTLFQSADIERAQNGFRLLGAAAHTLPFLALIIFGLGVLAARRRRRAVFGLSLVVAASMLLLGALLNGFRIVYLDAVPADQLPPDAAAAIYDQVVQFIRFNLRAVLVLFLAIAVVAWVTGPEPAPTAVRRAGTRAFDVVRHGSDRAGLDTGVFGEALGRYKNVIRAVIGGAVIVVYVMAAHPTGSFTLWLLAIALLVLVFVEVLARNPDRSADAPADDRSAPAT